MAIDSALALRILNNDRLRTGIGDWGDTHDLHGALVSTADVPIVDLNCLKDFTSDDRRVEGLLDIGFALLRTFDREPAARVTPLDRPRSLDKRLERRRLSVVSRRSWMALRDDAPSIARNADVDIRCGIPEDVASFATIHSAGSKFVRRMSIASTLAGLRRGGNLYYLAHLDGQAVATGHLLIDGRTAGIYALATMRPYRKRGVSSTILARAIDDARAAGCDLICLSAEAEGAPERLYRNLGFERIFESQTWSMPT